MFEMAKDNYSIAASVLLSKAVVTSPFEGPSVTPVHINI